jgi:hypothetical protein
MVSVPLQLMPSLSEFGDWPAVKLAPAASVRICGGFGYELRHGRLQEQDSVQSNRLSSSYPTDTALF